MKKKLHTVKNTFITNENYEVLFVWKTRPWKIHDYNLFLKDDIIYHLSLDTPVFSDSAYIWLLRDLWDRETINVSKKNWKINRLTDEEIEFNSILSSIRVKIEHTIWHIKKYNIVSHKFRNRIHWDYRTVKLNLKHNSIVVASWLQNLHRILL